MSNAKLFGRWCVMVSVICSIHFGIATFARGDTPKTAPYIKAKWPKAKFCTSVLALAADVNKDSKIKLVLVGKFPTDQVCGEVAFPYDADDVASFFIHVDAARFRRRV